MNTELEDKLSQPHYFRYVNYKKNILSSIAKMQKELDIPKCDVSPRTFEGVIQLYDDLCRYKKCHYTLKEWTSSRYSKDHLSPGF